MKEFIIQYIPKSSIHECKSIIIYICSVVGSFFGDKESVPRGGFAPSSLPTARLASIALNDASGLSLDSPARNSSVHSLMLMQFGQLLDHDLMETPMEGNSK